MLTYIENTIIGNCLYLRDAGYTEYNKHNKRRRLGVFKCNCGKEFTCTMTNVKRKNTTSCGCYNKKLVTEKSTTHGLSKHPLYGQWQNIKNRCYNSNIGNNWKFYGEKGVTVCEEWRNDFLSFYQWAILNNWKKNLSVDRIDNNLGYSPENCRLATDYEQARNRKSNINVVYDNKHWCLKDLCNFLNKDYLCVRNRYRKYNWSLEKSLFTEKQTRQ